MSVKCEFLQGEVCNLVKPGSKCNEGDKSGIIACLRQYIVRANAAVIQHGTAAMPGIGERVAKAEAFVNSQTV